TGEFRQRDRLEAPEFTQRRSARLEALRTHPRRAALLWASRAYVATTVWRLRPGVRPEVLPPRRERHRSALHAERHHWTRRCREGKSSLRVPWRDPLL